MKGMLRGFVLMALLLSGCHRGKKVEADPFPLSLALKSYTVVNYIPKRSGKSLDYLLKLDAWARSRIKARGFSGEGVLSLIEGAVDVGDIPGKKGKYLSVDIVVAFEIKNVPAYAYKKMYFRISEQAPISEKDMKHIEQHLHKYLKQLDVRLYHEISAHLGPLMTVSDTVSDDKPHT